MRIGYARVSTTDQNPALQIEALHAAGVDEVVTEKRSGKDRKRPVLEATLARLEPGDAIVVWKLDRLGRSLVDLDNIVHELADRGIGFVSLTDGIDTSANGGELNLSTEALIGFLSVMARFERGLIRERIASGRAIARKNGKIGGRQRSLSVSDEDELLELWDTTSVGKLAERYKCDRATVYRARNRALARREDPNGKR